MSGWALTAAIVLLAWLAPMVARLRELASLRLPGRIERRVAPVRAQPAVDDLFQPLEAELLALGFRFSHATQWRAVPRELTPWRPVRVYVHAQYPILAQVMAPGLLELPNLHALVMLAQVREGLMVGSSNLPWSVVPPDPQLLRTAGEGHASVKEQYEAQLAAMRAEGLPDFLPWGEPEQIEARLTDYENRTIQAAVGQGWCRPDGEALCVSLRRLPELFVWTARRTRLLRRTLAALPDDSVALKRAAPLERSLLIYAAGKLAPRPAPLPPVQWALYGGSCLLFLLLAWLVFDLTLAACLLVVVALHEAGHYLAMRAFGYRRTQMLMLPLVGGVAFGEASRPDAWHRALVALAGPVPGLLLGLALLWAVPAGGATALLAWLLVFINALNLLPFAPLDGGQVLEALLPARHAAVRIGLEALAACGLLALAWWFGSPLLLVLLVLRVLGWGGLWRQLQFERWYRRAAARMRPADAKAAVRLSFQLLERLLPARASLAQRVRMVDEWLDRLRDKPMAVPRKAGLAVLYAVLLALPVAGLPRLLAHAQLSFLSEEERLVQAGLERAHQAREMDIAALARAVDVAAGTRAPASSLALESLATRTGRALPDEVHALYQSGDGLRAADGLELHAVADVRPLRDNRPRLVAQLTRELRERHPQRPGAVPIACETDPDRPCFLPLDQVAQWLQVGSWQGDPLLLHPQPHPDGRWRLVLLAADEARLTELPALRVLLESSYLRQGGPAVPAR